jgi:hypothetical protein
MNWFWMTSMVPQSAITAMSAPGREGLGAAGDDDGAERRRPASKRQQRLAQRVHQGVVQRVELPPAGSG